MDYDLKDARLEYLARQFLEKNDANKAGKTGWDVFQGPTMRGHIMTLIINNNKHFTPV